MEYNLLGKSGTKVSSVCLGTSLFGSQQHALLEKGLKRPASDDEVSTKILKRFVELGGNFIDCSDMYSHGEAEKIVGNWLSSSSVGTRDRMVITTKVSTPIDRTNPNSVGLSRKHIMYSIENSLKNLQTSFVDMYMVHSWDPSTSIEDALRTFNDLVRSGKVRNIGVCNFAGYQLQKCVDYCKFLGLDPVINFQGEYNLLSRSLELEVFDVCRNEGITVTPWGSLKGGWLTDKFTRGLSDPPKGSRIAWGTEGKMKTIVVNAWDVYKSDEKYWRLRDVLGDIAKKHNKSVAQVSIRWCLQKDVIPSVVIGPRTMEQLEDNMGAACGWRLTQEEMAALDEASDTPLPDTYYTNRLLCGYRANSQTK